MIVAVAVCPGAPLLVPGLAPGLAAVAADLVDSCAEATATLRCAHRILLLTSGPRLRDVPARRVSRGSRTAGPRSDGPRTADIRTSDPGDPHAAALRRTLRHPPGTVVNSSLLADSGLAPTFASRLAGAAEPVSGPCPPGVGVVVGSALLDAAALRVPTTAVELGDRGGSGFTQPDVSLLYGAIGGSSDRVGLLVIGEGTAGRGPDAPSGGQIGAEAFDATLAAALAVGDPAALAAAVAAGRRGAPEMPWTSGPSLDALSLLCADSPPTRAELLYDDAPFGVGYLVATWAWM